MVRKHALNGMLLLSLLVAAAPALAQRVASTIRGAVSDTSGAVIVGAKVTVKNEATGFTRTAETNASGVYTIDHLPPGDYHVIAVEPDDADRWQDPARLEVLTGQSSRLSVAREDSLKTLDLRVRSIR